MRKETIIVAIIIILLVGIGWYVMANQTVLGEHNNIVGVGYADTNGKTMLAQTFKIGCYGSQSDFEITSVNLLLYSDTAPHTLTVDICETDTSFIPTDTVLMTTTKTVTLESERSENAWVTFEFDEPITFTLDETYAIVVSGYITPIYWAMSNDMVYCYLNVRSWSYDGTIWSGYGYNWCNNFEVWGHER